MNSCCFAKRRRRLFDGFCERETCTTERCSLSLYWRFSWLFGWLQVLFYGFWHWMTYASSFARGSLQRFKYNADNQYEPQTRSSTASTPRKQGSSSEGPAVSLFTSSTGQLEREVLYTTLGWLQSAAFQCVMMHLWASGRLPYYTDFWAHPAWSLGHLLFVTYVRVPVMSCSYAHESRSFLALCFSCCVVFNVPRTALTAPLRCVLVNYSQCSGENSTFTGFIGSCNACMFLWFARAFCATQ